MLFKYSQSPFLQVPFLQVSQFLQVVLTHLKFCKNGEIVSVFARDFEKSENLQFSEEELRVFSCFFDFKP